MYFGTKNYLKNNHYHTSTHTLNNENRATSLKIYILSALHQNRDAEQNRWRINIRTDGAQVTVQEKL
jgi:hypothetical protein